MKKMKLEDQKQNRKRRDNGWVVRTEPPEMKSEKHL